MKQLELSKKVIGVLGRPITDSENYPYIGIYENIRTSILKKNCIPFVICPLANIDYINTKGKDIPKLIEEEKNILKEMVNICDGIIMPGGYRMYEYDKFVIEYAIEKDIPVLGICMGMQLLASIDNNEYCLEKNESNLEHVQPGEKYAHKINVIPNTKFRAIIDKNTIDVNSKHRYHVSKLNKFKVSAYSEDGLIEVIEMPNKKFVLGVQWHPENMLDYDEYANKIFDEFVRKM